MPQPEPTHWVSTGNQPVKTPSGCSNTFAVAVEGFDEVTMAILGCAKTADSRPDLELTISKKLSISGSRYPGRRRRTGSRRHALDVLYETRSR
jgi:hypothetical protein